VKGESRGPGGHGGCGAGDGLKGTAGCGVSRHPLRASSTNPPPLNPGSTNNSEEAGGGIYELDVGVCTAVLKKNVQKIVLAEAVRGFSSWFGGSFQIWRLCGLHLEEGLIRAK